MIPQGRAAGPWPASAGAPVFVRQSETRREGFSVAPREARDRIRRAMDVSELRSKIRDIKDFPTEGILFKDITTLLKDGPGWAAVIDHLAKRYSASKVDVVVVTTEPSAVRSPLLSSMAMTLALMVVSPCQRWACPLYVASEAVPS